MHLGGRLEYQFAMASSREMITNLARVPSSPPAKATGLHRTLEILRGLVLSWYFGSGATQYCGSQGASCMWSTNRLFDLWCRIVAEVVGGFHRLEVRDIGGVGLAYVAEVVAVGGGYFGGVVARTEGLASVPAGKGSRRCTGAP
jgi:hypothetical protein